MRSLEQLHRLNLQRCDRTTMYFGLEAREPFLDADARPDRAGLPPEWKQRTGGRVGEGDPARGVHGLAARGLLWRGKEQFGDGSGAGTVLAALAAHRVAEFDAGVDAGDDSAAGGAATASATPADCWPLRSDEEAMYFEIWQRHFAGVRADATLEPFATV